MTNEAILEGILFAFGEEGIDQVQLQIALDLDENETQAVLDNYKELLIRENRALELIRFGEKYKLVTRSDLHEVIADMLEFNKNRQLSQAALETLAIVAYRQPVTRIEIEEVRGVNSDMMCRRLEALDLIREAGRADTPGRPILYEVTESFLDVFKLTTLKELPEIKIETLDDTHELFKSNENK